MASLLTKLIGHQSTAQLCLKKLKEEKLPPNLLFTGQPGIGKTLFGRALAQAILCENQSDPKLVGPCGSCGSCIRVEKNQHESFLHIRATTLQIRMEDLEPIHRLLTLQKVGAARVILIEEAQRLNPQAANSCLKIFEEPPPATFFFLTATSASDVLTTIRSRFQILGLAPLKPEELKKLYSQGSPWMFQSAMGRADLMESLIEPSTQENRQLALRFLLSSLAGDRFQSFSLIRELEDRKAALDFVKLSIEIGRDLSFLSQGLSPIIHQDLFQQIKGQLPQLASDPHYLLDHVVSALVQAETELLQNADRNLCFEQLFFKISP